MVSLRHGFLNFTLYFAQGLTSETTISGEMLGTPTQCPTVVIYDDAGQKKSLN